MEKGKTRKIAIVCFDQFTDIDVFMPWDLLNRVRLVGKENNWEVKILGTADTHTSMAGLTIPTHGMVEEANGADAVIFASGTGIQRLIRDEDYLNRFKLDPKNQLIGSMCSGALLLGALKLLDGKKATTYPTVVHQLKEFNVDVVESSFVNEGNISTAAGCLAAEELVSWIVKELIGDEMVKIILETVQPVGQGLLFN
ncbi:DJ-1/PfpI family protein [Bacillus salitolerans]|uniref:DJ-1/PfpI family protein n=1 Tax=Bacillus salitolerans TaxID=1437434 RepID=A0ABW4LT66_9BACI